MIILCAFAAFVGALLSLPFVAFSVFRHRSGGRSTRRDGTVYGVINGLIVGCLGFVLTLMRNR